MSGKAWIQFAVALAAVCALLGVAGCETTATIPAGTQLAGSWQLDKTASDDAEAKVAQAMNTAQSRLRKQLARAGYGPEPGSQGSAGSAPPGENPADVPDYSFDTPGDRFGGPGRVGPDFRGLRVRLRQALIPPARLRLEVEGDLVTIKADELPPRDYRLGEKETRFDEYGTAVITASWTHDEFTLHSAYTSHASRSDTYHVEPGSSALTLTQQFVDPTVGRIVVKSVYRRS